MLNNGHDALYKNWTNMWNQTQGEGLLWGNYLRGGSNGFQVGRAISEYRPGDDPATQAWNQQAYNNYRMSSSNTLDGIRARQKGDQNLLRERWNTPYEDWKQQAISRQNQSQYSFPATPPPAAPGYNSLKSLSQLGRMWY